MNAFEKLKELFRDFPGIGPRQAERFAYFLLSKDMGYLKNISTLIEEVKQGIAECRSCMRFFTKKSNETICPTCSDASRDAKQLMVVSRDNDYKVIEGSGAYRGFYFILGGLVPILEKDPQRRIRLAKLLDVMDVRVTEGLQEVVFALSATHEGEHTEMILEKEILSRFPSLKISRLGRGISTGLEIEYSDSDTIKAALQNKK